MDIDLAFVPVDGSDRSERAAEYAVAVADRYEADLHLLFVLDERLRRDMVEGRVDPEAVADDHRAFTGRVRDALDAAAHDGGLTTSTAVAFSETRLTVTPGSAVLDAAEDVDADFIVVPREGDDESALGRAALYVIEYASQPVLSV